MFCNKINMDRKEHEGFLYMRTPPILSWRLDPDESHSDWTISVLSSPELEGTPARYFDRYEISSLNSEYNNELRQNDPPSKKQIASTKIYFVHRSQLAVGPRRSEFFANVFKRVRNTSQQQGRDESDSSRGVKNNENCTRIELIPAAANCFPIMLDFMYSDQGTPLSISTETAVALRRLASSFGIRQMFRDTTTFIKKDLTAETATTYLLEAKRFKNDKIQDTAMDIIASNFLSIKLTALVSLPPDLMIDVIQRNKFSVDDKSKFSVKIASYCRCREDELTLTLLDSLTPASILSSIDATESLYFLHLLFSLRTAHQFGQNLEAMNLYQLCLVQAPKVLKTLLTSKPFKNEVAHTHALRKQKQDLELYNSLPSNIKVFILERSFEVSCMSPDPPSKSSDSLKESRARKEVFKLQDEVKMLKVSYDKKVEYFQRMLDAKEEELKKFSDFSCAPNLSASSF